MARVGEPQTVGKGPFVGASADGHVCGSAAGAASKIEVSHFCSLYVAGEGLPEALLREWAVSEAHSSEEASAPAAAVVFWLYEPHWRRGPACEVLRAPVRHFAFVDLVDFAIIDLINYNNKLLMVEATAVAAKDGESDQRDDVGDGVRKFGLLLHEWSAFLQAVDDMPTQEKKDLLMLNSRQALRLDKLHPILQQISQQQFFPNLQSVRERFYTFMD